MRRLMVLIVASVFLAACVPDAPAPTRVEITTLLTWCGGVIPPPGEPWCHTNPTSIDVELRQKRTVIASGTTDAAGHLTVDVAAGTYIAAASSPEVYMDCDTPTVVAVAAQTTPVTQTCTVFAP